MLVNKRATRVLPWRDAGTGKSSLSVQVLQAHKQAPHEGDVLAVARGTAAARGRVSRHDINLVKCASDCVCAANATTDSVAAGLAGLAEVQLVEQNNEI